ncbi:hypothetical protein ABZ490_27950 [Streptomyces sp. NPDC005811]|uniref:hypothetical protein n=1 Tax=Streptomyces sp. NPDC005811 TaxID=3154565 RepID=UPI00340F59BD
MPMPTRAGALTALAAAGLALATVLSAPAAAVPRVPGFLAAKELPPRQGSTWTAGRVTAGVPEEVALDRCLGRALGGGRGTTWYRAFRTDLDTSARQVTVELSGTAAAKSQVARLDKDIRSCPVRIERADPQTEARLKDYGKLDVEEGARVYGLHTESSWGATDIRLVSVGRDGRTVTVVDWGQLGDFGDAPVKAFKKTTVTAVKKLH